MSIDFIKKCFIINTVKQNYFLYSLKVKVLIFYVGGGLKQRFKLDFYRRD